ncbi:MAG: DUF4864 domain-containing protein [Alphaproteobacteria bacterium]
MKPTLLALAVLVFALPASTVAAAADVNEADRGAIRAVIEDQLAAFGRDDADAAFAHASPGIQTKFRTPEIFMHMVRTAYQPVYRPREVEFRDIVEIDGVPVQHVFLVGPGGELVTALYPMERQPDGAWKIAGCYLVRAPGEGV